MPTIDHRPECPVHAERHDLARQIQENPDDPVLRGAWVEYFQGGDQEAEVCTCPPRTILMHLNVEVPRYDQRDAGELALALQGAIEVGLDGVTPRVGDVCIPLAEEVSA